MACEKCGDCCRQDLTSMMIYENLTIEQRDEIVKPRTKEQCCQLTKEGLCGIRIKYGEDAQCDVCRQRKCALGKW